jgi:polyphenol oxidase
MNRRRFVRTVSQGSLAAMIGLKGTRLWAQAPPAKEPPINCAPPKHGAAKRITFDTSTPVLPRKSAWDLDAPEITRLQSAYQALRDLTVKTPNDPRGWAQQANIHCFNCSGGFDPSNVEIHGSWWFLPWHRCYLHIHERILGKLIGDPTFRLAYWDWDTYPGHAILPPPFLAPGALVDAYRGAIPSNVIPAKYTGAAAMAVVLGAQTSAGFMGSASQSGALENSPHGPVHIWTGNANPNQANEPVGCFYPNTVGGPSEPQSPNCLDMGVLATAAQDPIFFAHHSNIDRLWDVWVQRPGVQGNWKNTSWLHHKFNFFDENANWVYITVADVLAAEEQNKLRYSYQPPKAKASPTPASPTPSPKPTAAKETVKRTSPAKAMAPLMVHSAATATAVGIKPHVQSVAVPPDHQANLRTFADSGPEANRHYTLHIDGISLPPNEGAIVHVFAAQPDANLETPVGPSFVGTFSIVPSGPQHQHPMERNAVFELRPETAALVAEKKNLEVTLVPEMVNGTEPLKSNLTYKKIYLSFE